MTAQAARPPRQPLPLRPRPASGEPASSYIRRLALANHLRPAHLRHYLKDPATGGIRLGWLATLAGRPETSLRRALAGQQPPGGFPAGNRQRQPPPPTAAASRRDPRDRRPPDRPTPQWCSFCSRSTGRQSGSSPAPASPYAQTASAGAPRPSPRKQHPRSAAGTTPTPASSSRASPASRQSRSRSKPTSRTASTPSANAASAGKTSDQPSEYPDRPPGCASPESPPTPLRRAEKTETQAITGPIQ